MARVSIAEKNSTPTCKVKLFCPLSLPVVFGAKWRFTEVLTLKWSLTHTSRLLES